MRRRTRNAFTLIEVSVAIAILSLVLYILAALTSLSQSYFLADELSQAAQAASVLAGYLQQDLREALRDPQTGKAIDAGYDTSSFLRFYRGVVKSDGDVEVVPVRWSLVAGKDAPYGYMVRTTFDPKADRWDTQEFRWAPVPLGAPPKDARAAPDAAAGAPGFAVEGDGGDNQVQYIVLSVLARSKKVEHAGAAQDRATVQIAAAVPDYPDDAAERFTPRKKLEDAPAP